MLSLVRTIYEVSCFIRLKFLNCLTFALVQRDVFLELVSWGSLMASGRVFCCFFTIMDYGLDSSCYVVIGTGSQGWMKVMDVIHTNVFPTTGYESSSVFAGWGFSQFFLSAPDPKQEMWVGPPLSVKIQLNTFFPADGRSFMCLFEYQW